MVLGDEIELESRTPPYSVTGDSATATGASTRPSGHFQRGHRVSYSDRLSFDGTVQVQSLSTLESDAARPQSLRSTPSRYSNQYQSTWSSRRKMRMPSTVKWSAQVQRARQRMARAGSGLATHGVRPLKLLTKPFSWIAFKWRQRNVLPPSKDGRRIPVGIEVVNPDKLTDERSRKAYCNNVVSSGIYTIWDFIPRQLLYQFSKLANVYFLFVSILQMIPSWSTTGSYTTIIPLMVFVSISMGREGFDDWCRHRNDREENTRKVLVIDANPKKKSKQDDEFTSSGVNYTTKQWKDVKVGDIVRVLQNEWVPADIILLHSSGPKGTASVETLALDGETTLKNKEAPAALQSAFGVEGLATSQGLCITEDPNLDLYNFEGSFELTSTTVDDMRSMTQVASETSAGAESDAGSGPDAMSGLNVLERVPLGNQNIVYRGSMLRNTASAVGLVVFSGRETKVQMNATRNARAKSPKLQSKVNRIVMLMASYVLLLSGFSTLASGRIQDSHKNDWYIKDLHVGTTQNIMGFIIMFNTLIPLSLYVSMEICKLFQMFLMENDVDMYDATNDVPCRVQTASLNEELGQVSYIFSDKTGTLTDNIMLFRKMSIAGFPWLHDLDLYFEEEDEDEVPLEELERQFMRASMNVRPSGIPGQSNDPDVKPDTKTPSESGAAGSAGGSGEVTETRRNTYLFQKARPQADKLVELAEQLAALPRKSFGGRISNANRFDIPTRMSMSRPSTSRLSLSMTAARASRAGRFSRDGRPSSVAPPRASSAAPAAAVTAARLSRASRLSAQSGAVRPSLASAAAAIANEEGEPAWQATADPQKPQVTPSTLLLLEYIITHPHTAFSKRARFFLLALSLCHSASPEVDLAQEADGTREIEALDYQASSPDELALVAAARDLGYLVIDRQQDSITVRTYPDGFNKEPVDEVYEVLATLEFTSARKRMSNVIRFPDGRICLLCKGADNVMIERLNKSLLSVAHKKQNEIHEEGSVRRSVEADLANSTAYGRGYSLDLAPTRSMPGGGGIASLDEVLRRSNAEAAIQEAGRRSMQLRKRSLEVTRNVQAEVAAVVARKSIDRKSLDQQRPLSTLSHNAPSFAADQRPVSMLSHSTTAFAPDQRPLSMLSHPTPAFAADESMSTINSGDTDTMGGADDSNNVHDFHFDELNRSSELDDRVILERTLEQIDEFSTEGLRTLLYGHRFIPKSEYEKWKDEYEEARSSLVDRQKKLEAVGEKMEVNLDITGATAIEDKLQKGVPEAIEKLRRANIRMWMLTGDKRETAINIGYSCRLIKDYSTVVILRKEEDLNAKIMAAMEELEKEEIAHCVVVVDGAALSWIENDAILLSMFVDLGLRADSVIVCRASPAQKATMVKSVRKREPKKVMLAIGDGANDIAMIQSADLGIGIAGREGLQAARSSDYAIGQFRFLLKLLFVHGRWNYVRTCKYILSTFYKEFMFYMGQVVYQRNTMFTGTSLYESWSISMFNTLFTSLPVICLGVMDQDLSPTTLVSLPELYSLGQKNQSFGYRLFFGWICIAMLQCVMVNFCSYRFYGENYGVNDPSLFPLGVVVYTSVVYIVCVKLQFITMMHYITAMSVIAAVASMAGWLLWNLLIGAVYDLKPSKTYFAEHEFKDLLGKDLVFWASIFVITVIGCLFEMVLQMVRSRLRPSETDDFQLLEMDPQIMSRLEGEAYLELHQGWAYQESMDTSWFAFFRLKWPGQPRFNGDKARSKAFRTNRRRKRDILKEKLHITNSADDDREIEEILERRAREADLQAELEAEVETTADSRRSASLV